MIGKGVVSGTALDKSGLTGNICQQGAPANCVPKAIFGGFGSDITYTGFDNVFVAAPDRGPFDGLTDVPYLDRVHFLHITTDVGAPFPNITTTLLDTFHATIRLAARSVINRGQGTCDILAINDHEFLVVDRDNRSNLQTPPQAPTRKKIYKIDITGATDVSDRATLPAGALPAGVTPVTKTLFIDLLDADLNLAATIPEKIEGLAWGPDLPDGRHVLYVISDNDLNPTLATQIYAFAIDPSLLNVVPQVFGDPLFPPGQVKKLVTQ